MECCEFVMCDAKGNYTNRKECKDQCGASLLVLTNPVGVNVPCLLPFPQTTFLLTPPHLLSSALLLHAGPYYFCIYVLLYIPCLMLPLNSASSSRGPPLINPPPCSNQVEPSSYMVDFLNVTTLL